MTYVAARVEAHEAFERFEHAQHGAGEGGLTTQAALLVAILAGFLAVATFKANEAVKDAIQTQTKLATRTPSTRPSSAGRSSSS